MKTFFTLLICLATLPSFSQTSFGAKAGINLSSIAYTDSDIDDDDKDLAKIGLQIGAVSTIEISDNLSLLSEICFIQKGVSFSDTEDGIDYSSKLSLNYIDFNPSVLFSINENIGLVTGVYSGLLIGGKSVFKVGDESESETLDMDDVDNRWEIGINLGPTFTITDNINIDLVYKLGLTEVDDSDFKNRGLSIAGRIMF